MARSLSRGKRVHAAHRRRIDALSEHPANLQAAEQADYEDAVADREPWTP
jgi:hypothetical protein